MANSSHLLLVALLCAGALLTVDGARDLPENHISTVSSDEVEVEASAAVASIPRICTACQTLAEQLELALQDPNLVFKLKNILESSVCQQLPTDKRDSCVERVEAVIPALVAALQEQVTEDALCVKTKICDGPSSSLLTAMLAISSRNNIAQLKALPSQEEEDQAAVAVLSSSSTSDCKLCLELVAEIKEKFSDPDNQLKVLTFLVEECKKLPSPAYVKKCKAAVMMYLPVVLAEMGEVDETSLCRSAHVCPEKQQQLLHSDDDVTPRQTDIIFWHPFAG